MSGQSNGYVFGFAATVCIVCALGVATAAMALKPMQELNKKRDFEKNVLSALGLPGEGKTYVGPEIDQAYQDRVKLVVVDRQGKPQDGKSIDDVEAARVAAKGTDDGPALLPVYQRVDDNQVVGYALDLRGKGLWGPISGFLAVGPDGAEVTGATFFAPKETPGLGGDITTDKFRGQFVGKRINDGSQPQTIAVKKPGTAKILCPGDQLAYCVDGIAGATITSNGVEDMITDAVVTYYEPYLARVRGGGGS